MGEFRRLNLRSCFGQAAHGNLIADFFRRRGGLNLNRRDVERLRALRLGSLYRGLGARLFPGLLIGGIFRLLREQALPVGDGDLVIIRVNFPEGEEAVPVPAIFNESRL